MAAAKGAGEKPLTHKQILKRANNRRNRPANKAAGRPKKITAKSLDAAIIPKELITQQSRDMVAILVECGTPLALVGMQVPHPVTRMALTEDQIRVNYKYEVENSHALVESRMASRLVAKAFGDGKDSLIALIFWLKCKGWNDGSRRIPEGPSGTASGTLEFTFDFNNDTKINPPKRSDAEPEPKA